MTSVIRNLPSIVEQGTSGIWTYRKWSDGTAECWGRHTETGSFDVTWGSLYVHRVESKNYPSGLFIETPKSFSSGTQSGGNAWSSKSTPNTETTTGQTDIIRATAAGSTLTFSVDYYAIGKWK